MSSHIFHRFVGNPLFQGLSVDDFEHIAERVPFDFHTVAPGHAIVRADDPCEGLICTLSGTICKESAVCSQTLASTGERVVKKGISGIGASSFFERSSKRYNSSFYGANSGKQFHFLRLVRKTHHKNADLPGWTGTFCRHML